MLRVWGTNQPKHYSALVNNPYQPAVQLNQAAPGTTAQLPFCSRQAVPFFT
jgi:hypothetical protein